MTIKNIKQNLPSLFGVVDVRVQSGEGKGGRLGRRFVLDVLSKMFYGSTPAGKRDAGQQHHRFV